MLEMILLKTAIEKTNTTSICLSPTLEQARKLYKELLAGIVTTPIYKKSNDQRLNIKLCNGSEILFKSSEQGDALRGYTVSGIYCIDEAAYIPDAIFNITLAWCNVHRPPILICSSPHYKTGFFYKYYSMGMEPGLNNVFSYDWSTYDTSQLLDAETLENYRKTLAKDIFKTDFLGEFLDNESSVFGEFEDVLNDNPQQGLIAIWVQIGELEPMKTKQLQLYLMKLGKWQLYTIGMTKTKPRPLRKQLSLQPTTSH